MHARPTQSRGRKKDADPDSSRLPIVRDGKLNGSVRGRLPPIHIKKPVYERVRGMKVSKGWTRPVGKFGTFCATERSV
jgi:hypothetical protein